MDRAEAVIESSVFLGKYLSKYAAVEACYAQLRPSQLGRFNDEVVRVYAALYSYPAEVKQLVQKNLRGTMKSPCSV